MPFFLQDRVFVDWRRLFRILRIAEVELEDDEDDSLR